MCEKEDNKYNKGSVLNPAGIKSKREKSEIIRERKGKSGRRHCRNVRRRAGVVRKEVVSKKKRKR